MLKKCFGGPSLIVVMYFTSSLLLSSTSIQVLVSVVFVVFLTDGDASLIRLVS